MAIDKNGLNELSHQAGRFEWRNSPGTRDAQHGTFIASLDWVIKFAGLVAAQEREACAKECEHWQQLSDKNGGTNKSGEVLAQVIRSRK